MQLVAQNNRRHSNLIYGWRTHMIIGKVLQLRSQHLQARASEGLGKVDQPRLFNAFVLHAMQQHQPWRIVYPLGYVQPISKRTCRSNSRSHLLLHRMPREAHSHPCGLGISQPQQN